MKEFIGLLIFSIMAVLYLKFGNIALIGFGVWALGLYIHGRIYNVRSSEVKKILPFIRMNEEYALEKKCLYYFLPSLDESFDDYILSQIKVDRNSLYVVPKNPMYSGRNSSPYIRLLDLDIKFDLKQAYKKFSYRSTKVDNTILKINEYDKRLGSSIEFKSKKEMNLSHLQTGFGHIQQERHRSSRYNPSSTETSLSHKIIFTALASFILIFLFGLITYYSEIL
jgi:hypothetical protein